MSNEQKVTITNAYGGPVTVTVEQIGELIASVQCLPAAFNGEEDDLEHTLGVIERRLQALGLPADRRETAEYRQEMGEPDGSATAP